MNMPTKNAKLIKVLVIILIILVFLTYLVSMLITLISLLFEGTQSPAVFTQRVDCIVIERSDSLDDLIDSSIYIIEAVVIHEQPSYFISLGNERKVETHYIHYEVKVLTTYKGQANVGQIIEFVQFTHRIVHYFDVYVQIQNTRHITLSSGYEYILFIMPLYSEGNLGISFQGVYYPQKHHNSASWVYKNASEYNIFTLSKCILLDIASLQP